jgi:hypothetical protein
MAQETLREVLTVAHAAGIDVLPVKGVVTARTLYADPAERPLADIDVRVRPRDVARLARVGERAGWAVHSRSWTYQNVVFAVRERHVDVEASVGPRAMCALSIDTMLSRSSEHVEPFGFSHRRPEVHDHALLMCFNVFKDKLAHAAPHAVEDVVRIARAPGFLPGRLAELAREARSAAVVAIVADWLAPRESRWREVSRALGDPRPTFSRAYRGLVERGETTTMPMRLLMRTGSDSPLRRAEALAWSFAWTIETRARLRH